MTTIAELENTVRAYVQTISGRATYIQEQMGATPTAPYCTIFIMSNDHFEHDVSQYDFDTDTQTQRGLSLVTFAISVWGGGDAHQVANRIRSGLNADDRLIDIYKDFGKGEITPIQDITAEYRGSRQRRAEFKVSLYATLSESFGVSYFDKSDFTISDDTATIGVDNPPPSRDCNQ